jgi:transcriptional regulator with XRE-family HTH domain
MARSQEPLPLKDLVNFLFDTIRHPDGRPYTTQEVADKLSISPATINQMRTGRSRNPTLPTLREVCRFFDISMDFFQCRSYDECYALLTEDRTQDSPQAAEIAFRASVLSPKSQEDILRIITWVEAAERERKAGRDVPDFPTADE